MSLFENIVRPNILPHVQSETSNKAWARAFEPLSYTFRPSTQAVFDAIFGARSATDEPRYSQDVVLAPEKSEFVRTEGDVVRLFNKQIGGPVLDLWRGRWLVDQSSESSPFPPTQFQGFVDTHFFNPRGYEELSFVEFKAPGTIDSTWWTDKDPSSGARRLGRELRGYAYEYRCPQGACYDGHYLLVFSFPAANREDIKTCNPDIFIINAVEPTPQGGIYLRYALDRLFENGVRRAMALKATDVRIRTWTRLFDWFDGRPYWYDETSRATSRNVPGIERRYIQQHNRWAWYDGGEFHAYCAKSFF